MSSLHQPIIYHLATRVFCKRIDIIKQNTRQFKYCRVFSNSGEKTIPSGGRKRLFAKSRDTTLMFCVTKPPFFIKVVSLCRFNVLLNDEDILVCFQYPLLALKSLVFNR